MIILYVCNVNLEYKIIDSAFANATQAQPWHHYMETIKYALNNVQFILLLFLQYKKNSAD